MNMIECGIVLLLDNLRVLRLEKKTVCLHNYLLLNKLF